MSSIAKTKRRSWFIPGLVIGLLLGLFLCLFVFPKSQNLLGIESEQTSDSQSMVNYIEKADEHVFLNVGIEKVETPTDDTKILWDKLKIPFSDKKSVVVFSYDAKLGINKPATVERINDKSFKVTLPEYEFIGANIKEYRRVDTDSGVLSVTTPDIDEGKVLADSLSEDEQKTYLDKYKDDLNDSAKDYYETLFKSLGDDVQVEVVTPDSN